MSQCVTRLTSDVHQTHFGQILGPQSRGKKNQVRSDNDAHPNFMKRDGQTNRLTNHWKFEMTLKVYSLKNLYWFEAFPYHFWSFSFLLPAWQTDRRTEGPTDGTTDRRTRCLLEIHGCIYKGWIVIWKTNDGRKNGVCPHVAKTSLSKSSDFLSCESTQKLGRFLRNKTKRKASKFKSSFLLG